jgi:hypothetical protein
VPAVESDSPQPFCAELEPHVDQLIAVIVPQLTGRVWEGKHMVLRALADIAVYCQPHFTPATITDLLGHFAKIIAKPLSDAAVTEGPEYISALQWRIDAVTGASRMCQFYAGMCDCFVVLAPAIDAAFANFGQAYTISRVSPTAVATLPSTDAADVPKRNTGMVGMRQNADAADEKRANEKEAQLKRNELMCGLIMLTGTVWPLYEDSVASLVKADANLPSHIALTVLAWMKMAPFDAKSVGYAALERLAWHDSVVDIEYYCVLDFPVRRIFWRTAVVGKVTEIVLSSDVIQTIVDTCCMEAVTESRFGVVRADALSLLITLVSNGFGKRCCQVHGTEFPNY